ncbi:MAG: hypothetical protein Q8R36_01495 [bacterium]|nr:hypothetical protein [bacterium]
MFRKRASGILGLAAALSLLGACAGDKPEIYHNQITEKSLLREQVFYTQVKTSSDATMGAIYHINAKGEATLLATNVDEAFWKDLTLELLRAGAQVGSSAVFGVSIPAAKNAISATSTANPTAKVCTEAGGGNLTGC